ncbi:MAG: hypothetical protein ACOYJX_01245 [Acutalibacteraceae bacterium]|jgi:putative flippase GtrA
MEKEKTSLKQKGSRFIEKHGEIWKIIKWVLLTGIGVSGLELVVHMFLLNYVFSSLHNVAVTTPWLLYIKVTDLAYLYAFLISATLGYSIAFIVNRKVTFHADANPALSAFLALLLVIFNIFATAWLGSAVSSLVSVYNWGWFGDVLVKVAVMAVPSLWVYPVNRFIIHRKKKENTAAEQ